MYSNQVDSDVKFLLMGDTYTGECKPWAERDVDVGEALGEGWLQFMTSKTSLKASS